MDLKKFFVKIRTRTEIIEMRVTAVNRTIAIEKARAYVGGVCLTCVEMDPSHPDYA